VQAAVLSRYKSAQVKMLVKNGILD